MPEIEIVSHPLCPFAQRLVLVAMANGWQRDTNFKVTYLDLRTLKQTAGAHSPSGEIPALKVDGQCRTTTTEQAAEYLDQITGGTLQPVDPAQRLVVRERERKVRATLDALRGVFTSQSPEALTAALDPLFGHLADIDRDLASDGTDDRVIRMDMIALAPVFSLAMAHNGLRNSPRWDAVARLRDIGRRMAEHSVIKASRCPNYADEFATFFAVTISAFRQAIAT
jgi:glutathione S-transferase